MPKFLKNFTVKVSASEIEKESKNILIQHHRFPGTNSTVLQASLEGVELAIASSPCVDPRNFSEAVGIHYGGQKVKDLAINKIWEMKGIELLSRLQEHEGSDEAFMARYPQYTYVKIDDDVVYKSASIELFVPELGLEFTMIEHMKYLRIKHKDNVYVYDRTTLEEVRDRRIGVEPMINIRHYVETYLREANIES